MIHSLENRVEAVAASVIAEYDTELFDTIQTHEDIENSAYIATKNNFSIIREAADIKYLYTACFDDNGNMIYHIDGLPMDDEDFRYPGDLIEEDFIDSLLPSLNGEIIMPTSILHTEWGDLFTAYYPIYDQEDQVTVVGALGIEFNATSQYTTYRTLQIFAPIVIFLTCILASIFAHYYFRRISNPNLRTHLNTDELTNLKNRRAFDVDYSNLCALAAYEHPAIIIADLNKLKYVNDTYGHLTGDEYIVAFSNALMTISSDQLLYRIGGDEFIILMNHATPANVEHYIERVKAQFSLFNHEDFQSASASFGYAFCVGNTYGDWLESFRVADKNMYANKSDFYNKYGR